MQKVFSVFLIMILLAGTGVAVQAEIRSGAFYLTPQIGGYVFEGNQNLEHSPTYGLGVGYALDNHWAAELTFNLIDAEFDAGPGDVDGYLLRLDGLYHFTPEKRLVPYLAAGIGGLRLDPDVGSSDSSFLVNGGGGVKVFLTDAIALRGDARYVLTFDDTHNNLIYTLSLDFLFGGKRKVAAVAAPADSDGDGVTDDRDRCPGTPAGIAVDDRGCPPDSDGDGVYDYQDQCPDTPAGVTVDASGCPMDSDGDGVYDYQDQCPDTPAGVTVDAGGCPLDSDGDGVYDYQDQCPDTPRNLKVDSKGCPIMREEQVSIKLDIAFEVNKAEIRPRYRPELQKVADFLKTYPTTTVVIEGHTDSTGEAAYNLDLSQRRADSVRDYLIDNYGISPDRLTAKGYGEERPVASNDTAEGRTQNRRVIAVISAEKQTYEKK
jgi:OOP family OmpA-OmpF porin